MLSLQKKASFILSRTAYGRELCGQDKILVDQANQGHLDEDHQAAFEWLFEFVRQNNQAPKRWLFDLPGLVLKEDGEVQFGDQIVDRFQLRDGQIANGMEKYTRDVLYPACQLAKRYRYRHLSMTRIPFFINEVLSRYCLRPTSPDTYFEKQNDFRPSVEFDYGFLFGHPACMRDDQTPLYQPFLRFKNEFFFCERFLSVAEFQEVSLPTWISNLPNEKKAKVAASLVG